MVIKGRGVREEKREEATGAFVGTQASGIDNEHETSELVRQHFL
jgi:hypothetical protein